VGRSPGWSYFSIELLEGDGVMKGLTVARRSRGRGSGGVNCASPESCCGTEGGGLPKEDPEQRCGQYRGENIIVSHFVSKKMELFSLSNLFLLITKYA